MTLNLIFPAIIVFVLMFIGVVLTVLEFKHEERKQRERLEGRNNPDGRRSD